MSAVILLVSWAFANHLESHTYDVTTAFLHAPLDKPVFMEIPQGFERRPGMILRIEKALYGLKQAPRLWNLFLMKILKVAGLQLVQSTVEKCLLYRIDSTGKMIVFFWVDDINVFTDRPDWFKLIDNTLKETLKIKYMGNLKKFIGITFDYDLSKPFATMDQESYVQAALKKFDFLNIPPSFTPIHHEWFKKIFTVESLQTSPSVDKKLYQRLLGTAIYLAYTSRPDILTAANMLAGGTCNPKHIHMVQMMNLFGYLKRFPSFKLKLGASTDLTIRAFADSDWAANTVSRRSRAGTAIFVLGTPIHLITKDIHTLCGSTAEAEFFALHQTIRASQWIKRIISELDPNQECTTMLMYSDNQAVIKSVHSEKETPGLKHIELKYHIAKQLIAEGKIKLTYIKTTENVADFFTKPLKKEDFNFHKNRILWAHQWIEDLAQ